MTTAETHEKTSFGRQRGCHFEKKKKEASNANRYLKARSFVSVGPEVMQSNGV